MSPKKKPPRNPHPLTKAEAEKRKLTMMRLATTDASSKYNIGGREKARGSRNKPTLAEADRLKKFGIGEED